MPERADRLRLQVILPSNCRAADRVILHVVLDPFVRVQVWRVRRQEEELNFPLRGLDEFLNRACLVNGTPVDDQEDATVQIAKNGNAVFKTILTAR